MAVKRCTKCLDEKDVEADFHRQGAGRRPDCKDCNRAAAKARHRRDPDAAWRCNIWRRYALTPSGYEAIVLSQGGVCAICGTDDPGRGDRHFSIDHDHATGVIRGALCINCNRALGYVGDSPERLRKAANYLEGTP